MTTSTSSKQRAGGSPLCRGGNWLELLGPTGQRVEGIGRGAGPSSNLSLKSPTHVRAVLQCNRGAARSQRWAVSTVR